MNTPTDDIGLRELFEAALDRPPSERAAYLESRCADGTLRARVEALLQADTNTGDPLRADWADRIACAMGDDADWRRLPFGGRIGPFEIVRVLGEGGFATVFEGRRDVEGVVQHVAVKLLHRGLHTPDARRRFEHERRALLRLRHPNIARMIEGGVTDAGLAYIALDLVEGVPITDYARGGGLGLSRRLLLFVDVCRAVEAAHRALIVHRDLKPSNVLVAGDGTVNLLDFGVAKLLGGDDDDRTAVPAFTPTYAAPEQRLGGSITTATDVYSLGVLLDELLTGTHRAPDDTRAPSARVGDAPGPGALPAPPATTRKLLRGELDAVVLKATAEEPERRYASAGALADDIERHLARRPVLAHPPSRWYRARKFIARHRVGVATTGAFLLAVLASLGIALWQAKIAREQARIAQRESARAQAEKHFVTGLFEPLRTGVQEGEVPSLRQLLDAGVAQLDARFAGDAAALADLSLLFSQVNTHIGEKQAARDLARRAYAHARTAFGERDARTLVALGQRGRTAAGLARYAEAETDLVRAVAGMQALGLRDDDYAFTLQDLSGVRAYLGKTREALADATAAYDILHESAGAERIELVRAMNNLGFVYNAAGDTAQGLEWQQRAIDWYAAHGLGETRAALIASGNVANGKSRLGRWRDALSDLERLLPLERKIAGGSHDFWINTAQACSTAISLALSDKAETYCSDAVRHAGREKGSGSPLAITRAFLGRARVMQGRYAEARADLAEATRLFAGVEGDQSAYLRNIALDSAEMLRVENATDRFVAALAPLVNAPGFDRERNAAPALARFALACVGTPAPDACRDNDTAARAEALLAVPARERHPIRLPTATALALRAVRLGEAPHATEMLEAALAATLPELGADHPWVAEAEAALAIAAGVAGRDDLARSAKEESLRIALRLPPAHPLRKHLLGMR